MKYDFLIVGAGLFGAVCARELTNKGFKVLVIEKRDHIAGNAYTEKVDQIHVHKYGAHIFHTNDRKVWEYVNSFCEFNRFTNSPLARYKNKLYNLPFNMNTFYQLWGVIEPDDAKTIIEQQRADMVGREPNNLEEQAISLVGRDVYNTLIKGYTEKQWGRKATELPAFIIKRIPVRFTYDNNYFSDRYQGIPIGGYTKLVKNLLKNIDVRLQVDYHEHRDEFAGLANVTIYTGAIDQYFNYCYGELEYRSLRFDTTILNKRDFQGNAVVNYTEDTVPYTRIIEHKHFDPVETDITVITKEYPSEWKRGDEAYYPVNDDRNMNLYKKYRDLAKLENNVVFGGRLAEYKYYDMHQVIASALHIVDSIIGDTNND